MLLCVDEPSKITWIWHDAELRSIMFEWSLSAGLSVRLRSEINPEEDRQELIKMGITNQLVDVVFRDVRQMHTNVPDVTDGLPFMLDWDIIDDASIERASKDRPTSRHTGLPHHLIGCSDGSTIEIVFTQLWLEEVNVETTK